MSGDIIICDRQIIYFYIYVKIRNQYSKCKCVDVIVYSFSITFEIFNHYCHDLTWPPCPESFQFLYILILPTRNRTLGVSSGKTQKVCNVW